MRPNGYGQYRDRDLGLPRAAHVMVWESAHGPIPMEEGAGRRLSVCHTCDNPRCCNLDHLFLGTHAENMADAARKGKFAKV